MIKGVDGYMDWNQVDPQSPYGMKSYKMREFDMIFKGEAAWRAYFAGDRATLEKLIPEETIAIEPDNNTLSNRQIILNGAEQFAKSGGKLFKLEFPKTEIQMYGFTAV